INGDAIPSADSLAEENVTEQIGVLFHLAIGVTTAITHYGGLIGKAARTSLQELFYLHSLFLLESDVYFLGNKPHKAIDRVEVFRDQLFIPQLELIFLFDKTHKLHHSSRVDDFKLEQGVAVGQRFVLPAKEEVLDNELAEFGLIIMHLCTFFQSFGCIDSKSIALK